jgi:hypothetical protein
MTKDDTTALEQEALEELAAEREALEARFPPKAFTGIAKALEIRSTPENLARLRGWLLRDFYSYLCVGISDKEPTRKERIARLKQLREAATILHSSIANFEDVWPLNLIGPDGPFATDNVTNRFTETLRCLADTAASEIEKLRSRKSRRGRPPKNEPFRQFTPRLVRKYERLMKERAGCPYWLRIAALTAVRIPSIHLHSPSGAVSKTTSPPRLVLPSLRPSLGSLKN